VLREPLPEARARLLACLATHATLAGAMGLHAEADERLAEAAGHLAALPEAMLASLENTRRALASCAARARPDRT
jgi:hypothetical protein